MRTRDSFYTGWALFLVVLLAVIVGVNVLGARIDVRLDLTEEKLHTISTETRAILEGLEDIITVQYYVSEKMPAGYHNLPRDTMERLRDYERIAGGKLRVEIIDPDKIISEYVAAKEKEKGGEEKEEEDFSRFDPFGRGPRTPRDEKIQELANQGVPMLTGRVVQDDKVEVVNFYSSILLRYLDKQPEAITPHSTLDGFEYEMASRVLKLITKTKPQFAFFLGKPDDTTEEPPQFQGMPPMSRHAYEALITQVFEERFDVKQIELKEGLGIPEGVPLVLVAEPHNLEDRQLYEIDRFLGRGGTVFCLASRHSGDLESGRFAITPLSHRLDKLLEGWGVRLGAEIIFSYACGTIAREQRTGPFIAKVDVPFPPFVVAEERKLNQSTALTQGLPGVFFPYASPLHHDAEKVASLGLSLKVLARSDDDSWLEGWAPNLNDDMLEPPRDRAGEPVYAGAQDLAYLIEGVFPALHAPGTPLPPWKKPEKKETETEAGTDGSEAKSGEGAEKPNEDAPPATPELVPAEERKPGRVILCASADMAKTAFLTQGREYQRTNVPFLLNAVESVALGHGLVDIRGKSQTARPLEELDSGKKLALTWGNILGVPVLVVLFGIARWLVRRAGSGRYEEEYLERSGGAGGGAQ